VVSKVPGNHNFDKCIEFSDGFRVFWSKHAYQVTQCLFYLTAVCLNMAAIVDTAQTVDSFFWSPLLDLWSFIRLGRTTRPTRIMGISHQIIFIIYCIGHERR